MLPLNNIVLLTFLLPAIGAVLVLAGSCWCRNAVRPIAISSAVGTLLLSLVMAVGYDPTPQTDTVEAGTHQMVRSFRWMSGGERAISPDTDNAASDPQPESTKSGLSFHLAVGVDGISLWLIVSTTLITIPALFSARDCDGKLPASLYALLLLLESSAVGVFAALDIIFFYVCLDVSVMLIFVLIGVWGGYDRRRVVGRLFVLNLAGSLLCLLGLTALVVAHAQMASADLPDLPVPVTFSIPELTDQIPLMQLSDVAAEQYWIQVNTWIFLALAVGFAVKVPIVPLHTWLPDTIAAAPTAVGMLLLGVVAKFGCYGWLRFIVPLFPEILSTLSAAIFQIAVAGVIYAGLLTLAQDDFKKMIAYAWISHGCLCAAGILSMSELGVAGGLLLLVGDGLTISMLVFLLGTLERHFGTREVEAISGLAIRDPRFAWILRFAVFSLIAVPGLPLFAGTILILMTAAEIGQTFVLGSLVGLLLVAWACLWMTERLLSGRIREPIRHRPSMDAPDGLAALSTGSKDSSGGAQTGPMGIGPASIDAGFNETLPAPEARERSILTRRETLVLVPILVAVLWMGVYPQFFIDRAEPSIARLFAEPEAWDGVGSLNDRDSEHAMDRQ